MLPPGHVDTETSFHELFTTGMGFHPLRNILSCYLSLLLPLFKEAHNQKGFPGGSVVKNPPAKAGGVGSIPGSGRSLQKGLAAHSSILAWEIPWTEEH